MSAAVEEVSLVSQGGALPEPVTRRGISESQWRTLFNLYPGAKPESALMVWDYCRSRQLDPMKKPCHIVPMRVKVNGEWMWRDVVMPGIYEYRITAQRTGLYLGHTEAEYGPEIEYLGVKAPAWCSMTIFRWNTNAREKVPFPIKVLFVEVVATREDRTTKAEAVNERWSKAPVQMLTKCTEAAGLREAFPEEIGGDATAEEMTGQRTYEIDDEPRPVVASTPKPAQRKSEQAPAVQAVTAAQVEIVDEPVVHGEPVKDAEPDQPSGPPSPIGIVVNIDERTNGAIVKLDTGFACATRSAEMIAALKQHRQDARRVELCCRAPKSASYAPTLESIEPVQREVGEEG